MKIKNSFKLVMNIILIILSLTVVFACVTKQKKETIAIPLTEVTETPEVDKNKGMESENNDQNVEEDKPDYIPNMNIDVATDAIIDFWKENHEDLACMAEEMKARNIRRIDVFSNSRLCVQYNSNAFSSHLDCSDCMGRIIEKCKEDTVCLTDCEFVWAEFKNLLSSECMCFYYGTRVFKDERYGCYYSLALVLLGDHFQEIKPGWDAEELGDGWILITYELE